jgi:hypothetical protein
MDWVLERLPENIGYWLDGNRINSLAYADDIILTASSRPGLQCLLNSFAENIDSVLKLTPSNHTPVQQSLMGNLKK